MEVMVREIRPDEVEQEITQRDQFNTDEAGLLETLMREPHQNSLDGRSTTSPGPVRTRVQLCDAREEDSAYWSGLLSALEPHLKACSVEYNPRDLSRPRLLIIEDFGTTGLLGAWNQKDNQNFSDFWRRFGRSHKGGAQGGRWGLGKLVFSYASTIRTFFGTTIRDDDALTTPLLMGQAVLSNHTINGKEYAPHAFFAVPGNERFQLPETNPEAIDAFSRASFLTRTKEPGLSIVIPCVREDVTTESLLPFVVRNYFFPILTGRLVVELGTFVLDETSFESLARQHGGVELQDGSLIGFIRELHFASKSVPTITLGPNWSIDGIEQALDEIVLKGLREAFTAGKLVVVRAPIVLRRKGGEVLTTFVDLVLKRAPEGAHTSALYVRGSITIPGEAKTFIGRGCFGALIATDSPVAEFLGDAENPSHTRWTGSAEKLSKNWKNGSTRISELRSCLNRLYDAVAGVEDRVNHDALIDFFSVEQLVTAKTTKKADPKAQKPIVPPIQSRPKRYRITRISNGFAVKGNAGVDVPYSVRVRAAHAVFRGNPFSKYKTFDFDFTQLGDITVEATGANWTAISANELEIEVSEPEFSLAVKGFDANRDLIVRDGAGK